MCAAAAAKAATILLFGGSAGEAVEVTTPRGVRLTLPLSGVERGAGWARACVVKDAGDDPDVTHGLPICAEARPAPEGIHLAGGPGIGVVTKPGLPVPVGEPAINPVPREVIRREVASVLPPGRGVHLVLSAPGGERVARRTFNPRLGIVGGISILGTTGIVEPMSERAWRDSLDCQVRVAVASGHRTLVLVPGRTGERLAVERYGFPPGAVVQTANFPGHLLRTCAEEGAREVLLFGYHGKLVKLAAGCFNTHSRASDARLETLAALAAARGAGPAVAAEILDCATAEGAVEVLRREALLEVLDDVAARAAARARSLVDGRLAVGVVLVDRAGNLLGRDPVAAAVAGRLGVRLPEPVRPALAPGL
ncbi:MAG: cobalamin biosynthesis protein CbiD, partial [Firmicutes bacterium]|nr:cobalamin biosynthesis protein CbiD [Bacillota bacterium]